MMTLNLEFDLDLNENITTWCHFIIRYCGQFEVFGLEMTLTFN